MTTTVERLTVRLAEQGFEPVGGGDFGTPHRIYTGWVMRAEGTWSWGCYALMEKGRLYPDSPAGKVYVGGPVNMTSMLKCRHRWEGFQKRGTTDFEIHPCDECAKTKGTE